MEAAGIEVFPLNIRHRLDLLSARALRKLYHSLQPDVVYAPKNDGLAVSLLAAHARRPAVVGYRGTIGHISRLDPAAWLTYLNPRCQRIVCVSEAVRDYLLSCRIPAPRLVTVYKGHDPAWYTTLPKPTRAELGLPTDAFLLGFTGRIRPVKGGDVLLEALRRVPSELNVHLVMVGDIVDPRVRRLAEAPVLRDRVHRLGYRTDAAAIAGLFDVFAMPSVEREGFPRAVIEAMAQGVPPIVSRVGGMPELVRDDESGLTVPPRDPAALAEAIAALAADPERRRRLGAGARRRIATTFHIDHTIARLDTLFQEAAMGRVG